MNAFTEALDERLRLARVIHNWLLTQADRRVVIDDIIFYLRVTSAPILSALTFRLEPAAGTNKETSTEELKALTEQTNRILLAKINSTKRFLLFGTVLLPAAMFVIRVCILSVRTTVEKVDELLQVLDQSLSAIDASSTATSP